MNLKFGIGNKLFLGFGSMIILSIVTSVVLWDRFQDIANTQQLVIENAIPAMNEAQQLSELSAGIIASAPELVKVNNEPERIVAFQNIKSRIRQVDELLSSFDRHGFSRDQVGKLKTTINQVIENVTQQDSLVMIRLKYERQNRILTHNSIKAVKQLSLIAESLVANTGASTTAVLSTVYDLIEPAAEAEKVYEVLDRLIEVEFDDLERMFELRLRSSILMDQIQQISTELDPLLLDRIDTDIHASLAILGRRIDDINDPGRFEQANDLKAQLVSANQSQSRTGFRITRDVIISALARSDNLSSDNHARLEVLNEITANLVNKSQQVIGMATEEAEGSVYRARLALVVEPEPRQLEVASLMLRRNRYTVHVAQSATAALRKLRATSFDFVLCAYELGDMSAENFLRSALDIDISLAEHLTFTTVDPDTAEFKQLVEPLAMPALRRPYGAHELVEQLHLGEVAHV